MTRSRTPTLLVPPPLPTAARADVVARAVRRDAGLWGFERALQRQGFELVAGADEAGRGACAGPLVVAAVVLPAGRRGQVPGLADSKLLTFAAREEVYSQIVRRAVCWSVVVIPSAEVDRRGLHVSNVEGMRRAVAGLAPAPQYVLLDGFPVKGLGRPGLAVWKGDRVTACVAAASVVAKVTRDRIMIGLHESFPEYDFARHKGYSTPDHAAALRKHGPCAQHRFSYVNVLASVRGDGDGALFVDDAENLIDDLTGYAADVGDDGNVTRVWPSEEESA
ncbi:MAG: ribonuclease HII [Frankiaceae bacterium]